MFFAFSCSLTRIIEPLTSRCSKFRFKPLAVGVLKVRLEHIATQENVNYQPQVASKGNELPLFVGKLYDL